MKAPYYWVSKRKFWMSGKKANLHVVVLLLFMYTMINTGKTQCIADFSYTADSVTGNVQFMNLSTADTLTPIFYNWYSQSAVPVSTDKHPMIHLAPGTHTICLTVIKSGCRDSVCKPVTMPPVYCNSAFSYTIDQVTGEASFTNLSAGDSITYHWSFADGTHSTQKEPVHTFASNGWYYVCLNIYNTDSSCTDVTCEFVRVNKNTPAPCNPSFMPIYDNTSRRLVNFFNTTTPDSTNTFVWFINSDTIRDENPVYLFPDSGFYKVCMLVSGQNCADSVCKFIEILGDVALCNAAFTYRLYPDSGVSRSERIAVFSNASEGESLNYAWDFGDNTTSQASHPRHYYPEDGEYKVCLKAYNHSLACSDTMCTLITIRTVTGTKEQYADADVRVYPVPFTDVVQVELKASCDAEVRAVVYDLVGRIRHVSEYKYIPGEAVKLNLADMEKGLYLLDIHSGNRHKTVRIFK
jgi:PKD repeat protein